jgi:general secretion pathway protein J
MTDRNGFTLVEVVVALFVFGLLAAAGVALMSFALRAQGVSTARLATVSDERRMSAILIADLAQAVPRVTRGTDGEGRPAFQAEEGEELLFAFTRGGSRPQRVELRLENGRILRAAAVRPDGAAAATPMILAEGVTEAALRFRVKGEWQDRWTPTRTDELPRAVEITVSGPGKAPLRRLFLVGAGL